MAQPLSGKLGRWMALFPWCPRQACEAGAAVRQPAAEVVTTGFSSTGFIGITIARAAQPRRCPQVHTWPGDHRRSRTRVRDDNDQGLAKPAGAVHPVRIGPEREDGFREARTGAGT